MPSSTKKRTAAKKQLPQQQQQPPSALSPSSAAPTISNPAATAPALHLPHPLLSSTETMPPPPNISIDFETFIDLADIDDIIRFCDAVASTQEGRNLKLFWDRAFEAGVDEGQTEERRRGDEERKEMYFKGKAKGIEEAEAAARSAEVDYYHHGTEKGRTEERLEWTSAGHGPHCLTPIAILTDEIVQTDLESSMTATCDANVQACQPVVTVSIQTSPPSLVNVDMQTSVAMDSPSPVLPVSHLDWAEDATSLPIAPLLPTPSVPRQHAPRDFSGLRSSGLNPFGSLQRRSKQSRAQIASRLCQNVPFPRPLPFHYRPPLCPLPSFPTPRILPQASKNEPLVSSPSALNWDQDPHLFNLSHALKALGWIRPQQGHRF